MKRLKRLKPIHHGITGYNTNGCRCEVCKSANREYRKRRGIEGRAHGLASTYAVGCRCEPCREAKKRTRKPTDYKPTYVRDRAWKYKYNLTPEEYYEMLEAQGGTCALCPKKPVEGGRMFAVDHCHTTGRVRGILCTRCNTALGSLGDSVEGLERALAYLRAAE